MKKTTFEQRRREERYQAREEIPASVEHQQADATLRHSGRLVDLSRGGCKIALAKPIALQELVEVRLRVDLLQLDLTISARVCWTQPGPRDEWYLGCAFVAPICAETLDKLAAEGILERRRAERFEVKLPVGIRQELADDVFHEAQLVDYSHDGFRVVGDRAYDPDERLLLSLRGGHGIVQIPARCIWRREIDGRQVAGCSFLNGEGHEHIHRAVDAHTTRRLRQSQLAATPLDFWVRMGLLAVLIWSATQLWFIHPPLELASWVDWQQWTEFYQEHTSLTECAWKGWVTGIVRPWLEHPVPNPVRLRLDSIKAERTPVVNIDAATADSLASQRSR